LYIEGNTDENRIDVEEFAEQIISDKGLSGKDGTLTPLFKQLTEMTLQAELESHLAQDFSGHYQITVKMGIAPKL